MGNINYNIKNLTHEQVFNMKNWGRRYMATHPNTTAERLAKKIAKQFKIKLVEEDNQPDTTIGEKDNTGK